GGVVGALRGRADAIAEELARIGKGELVIPTLLRFADVEREGKPIRRRVHRRDLGRDDDEIVQAFIEARLLTSDGVGDDAVAEVAHEALLTGWPPLRQAIESSHELLRLRNELELLAAEWDEVGRSNSYLL